jgi:hypothetical protein
MYAILWAAAIFIADLFKSRRRLRAESFAAGANCLENPLWVISRIHGELLKVGFEIAQSTVSKYMVRTCRPPSQSWETFLQMPMRLPQSICSWFQR